MKPEAQQIAIAEACGWHEIIRPCDDAYHYLPTDTLERLNGKVGGIKSNWVHVENAVPIPDYLNDLNAMHESEKMLTEEQRIAYSDCTYGIARKEQKETGKWGWISLTAAQRAEAFLRAIDKWETTQP